MVDGGWLISDGRWPMVDVRRVIYVDDRPCMMNYLDDDDAQVDGGLCMTYTI